LKSATLLPHKRDVAVGHLAGALAAEGMVRSLTQPWSAMSSKSFPTQPSEIS